MNSVMFAMIIARQNKYIRTLKQLEATSARKSINLEEYGIRKSLIFNKLMREGIIIQTYHNRYYLDVAKEEEQRQRRRSIIIMLLILIISSIIISLITIDYFTGGGFLMIEKW